MPHNGRVLRSSSSGEFPGWWSKRLLVPTASALAALTLLGACGGKTRAEVPERLPPDQFERRLSQICATYEDEWRVWAEQFGDPARDLEAASRQAHRIARRMADDLLEIAPEGREDGWTSATANLDAGLDVVAGNDPPVLRHPKIRGARDALIDDFGAAGCFA